jgi:hypothetical protein
MDPLRQLRAQVLVVLGFAMAAVASVTMYIVDVTSVGFQFDSFRSIIDPLLYPLLTIVAVFAWFWLTLLRPHDEQQCRILRGAYFAFAVQYLLSAAAFAFVVLPFRSFGGFWITTTLWLELFGAAVTAVGFYLFAQNLRRVQFDQSQSETGVPFTL